ncbi:MAG: hypothetical protein LBD07_04030 [Spirochaetaceae bacterium]|nr:hypothetical protein [Spirochaetaceae bacterium]
MSCNKKPQDMIILAPTPPLSRSVIGYGLITSGYSRLYDMRGEDKKSIGLLRKGSVVEIIERWPVIQENKTESWLFVRGTYSGWIREKELEVYDTLIQAQTASSKFANK